MPDLCTTIRLLTLHYQMVYASRKRRLVNASILYEMPCEKRNEKCQGHNYEEW
jgi:hypothetical protein